MNYNQKLERAMVSTLVKRLATIGYKPNGVFDCVKYVPTITLDEVLEAVSNTSFAIDFSTISFKKNENVRGVLFVCGNGEDCISDYHTSDPEFGKMVDSVSHDANKGNYEIVFKT